MRILCYGGASAKLTSQKLASSLNNGSVEVVSVNGAKVPVNQLQGSFDIVVIGGVSRHMGDKAKKLKKKFSKVILFALTDASIPGVVCVPVKLGDPTYNKSSALAEHIRSVVKAKV